MPDLSISTAIFFPEKIAEAAIDSTADYSCITADLAFVEVATFH